MAAPIDPRTHIGHVHLKVADIERALGFYCGVLGFELQQRMGDQAAFVSAGGYHHHIGLNTWESRGGSPPPPGTPASTTSRSSIPTAQRSPTRCAASRGRHPARGACDHGVSEALYLRDPDGNGVELYRDRPRERWPRDRGRHAWRCSAPRWTERPARGGSRCLGATWKAPRPRGRAPAGRPRARGQ